VEASGHDHKAAGFNARDDSHVAITTQFTGPPPLTQKSTVLFAGLMLCR